MAETIIYLIRHAQSAPTPELPDSEWPLSSLGVAQASSLVNQLGPEGLQVLFSSPFPRAVNTLRPTAEHLNLEIQIHPDLRERKLCEGLVDDWLERLQQTWVDFQFAHPNGESSQTCQNRMVQAITSIASTNNGKRIAVSSHGNAIALFLNSIDGSFGFNEWQKMENPDAFRIVYSDGRFSWDRSWKLAAAPVANVSLALPSWKLRESYIECLKDFQAEDPSRPVKWEWLENFQIYLDWCKRERELPEMTEGRVPQTTYWIVYDGIHAVGKLTLRHQLTPELERLGGHFGYEIRPAFRKRGIATQALKLGIDEMRGRGFKEVIITCDDDNLGSIGVLENNSGKHVDTYSVEGWPKPVRKYCFSFNQT